MSQKTKSAVHRFREDHTVDSLLLGLRTEGYLIPKIVKDMGQLIGLQADSLFAQWESKTTQAELLDAYRELAGTTAILLHLSQIGSISDEAVYSVAHRLAATVDPLVSLHSRVDHLYRAFVNGEIDHIRSDAEKLWAALEYRSEAVTGLAFAELLQAE